MDKRKEFESFNESSKGSEIFSFSEKNNEKQFLNEDYVFKFEDNQNVDSGLSSPEQVGKEDNDNSSRLNENSKEGMTKEDIEKITNSSTEVATTGTSTAAVNSTVATVAATATTAVVIVVGGSIAVYGQSVDKPAICQVNEITAVENTINFSYGIGNSEEEILLTNDEGGECDLRIELLCPDLPDFSKLFEVKHYGNITGSFTDLEYDTLYQVNVYQTSLLDLTKTYLFEEAVNIKTEPAVKPVSNFITIEAELDPFGNKYFYSTITYDGDLSQYEYASLGVRRGELNPDDPYQEGTYEYMATLTAPFTQRQRVELESLADEDFTFHVDLTVEVTDEEESGQRWHREVLVTTDINFSKIEASEYQAQNEVSFYREEDATGETFYGYVDYTESIEQYMGLLVEVHYIDDTPYDEEIWSVRANLRETTVFPLDFSSSWSIYLDYTVIVYGQIDSDTKTELYRHKVNFSSVPYIAIPSVSDVGLHIGYTNYHEYGVLDVTSFDPYQKIEISSVELIGYNATSGSIVTDETYPVYKGINGEWTLQGYTYESSLIYTIQVEGSTGGDITTLFIKENVDLSNINYVKYSGCVEVTLGNPYAITIYAGDYTYYDYWKVVITYENDPSISLSYDQITAGEMYDLEDFPTEYEEGYWTVETFGSYGDEFYYPVFTEAEISFNIH